MVVPADIRVAPRPKNTIVDDNGHEGPNRYPVRERTSSKYIPGGNPQQRNGKVIGHLIEHQFVPIKEPVVLDEPDMLSYGSAALVKSRDARYVYGSPCSISGWECVCDHGYGYP